MAPKFGTSGLRGLVTELTDILVADYTHAFLNVAGCDRLYVGRDLRPSSPEIASVVCQAATASGVDVTDCGALGTPALALSSMRAGAAAVMVTGSHIPGDRNGLKFYLPDGEITKQDEAEITAAYAARARRNAQVPGELTADGSADDRYVARYVDAFGAAALAGWRIGVYRHSSVARDTLGAILRGVGADVVELGHSDVFVPVDTEAVAAETREILSAWCVDKGLDAIASTDGDADRPMLTDATGQVIPGDILGVVTARLLGARTVVTPVSSNDMVRRLPEFDEVVLTRIGSPFVIAGMAAAKHRQVVGFEANGGFLLGFDAEIAGPIAPLPTRDCMLPILAPMLAAQRQAIGLSDLMADLPKCFTATDRLQDIDRDRAGRFLRILIDDAQARHEFFAEFGAIAATDLTDGLRVDFETGVVVHLRPSGNAPEFRIYAQAESQNQAQKIMEIARKRVANALA